MDDNLIYIYRQVTIKDRDPDGDIYIKLDMDNVFLGVSTPDMREECPQDNVEFFYVNASYPWQKVDQTDVFRFFNIMSYCGRDGVLRDDMSIPQFWNNMHVLFIELDEDNYYRTIFHAEKMKLLITARDECFDWYETNPEIYRVFKDGESIGSFTAINRNELRKLFNRTRPDKHKKAGFMFRLIPYINRQWNIVCHNPEEPCLDNVMALSAEEIEKILKRKIPQIQEDWPVKLRDDYLYYDPEFIYGGSRKDDAIKLFTGKLH